MTTAERVSYWHHRNGAGPSTPPLTTRASADIVVVGAGLAGLATAHRILDRAPGTDVVILESDYAGYGASGRNGGLLSPLAAPVWLLDPRNGPRLAAAARLTDDIAAAAAWAAAHAPSAELGPASLRLVGTGRWSRSALGVVGRSVAEAGIPHAWIDGSLTVPAHTVEPMRLVVGLAASAVARGVRLHEGSPVAAVAETGTGATVTLRGGGSVTARRVVIATNAATRRLELPERVPARPVENYMLAVSGDLSDPATGGVFSVEVGRHGAFYRSHHGTLLYGAIDKAAGRSAGTGELQPDLQRRLLRCLAKSLGRTPPAVACRFWSGQYHQTWNDLPIIRPLGRTGAIVANVGYGGTGVALTLAAAPIAASLALGIEPDDRAAAFAHEIAKTPVPIAAGAAFLMRTALGLIRS